MDGAAGAPALLSPPVRRVPALLVVLWRAFPYSPVPTPVRLTVCSLVSTRCWLVCFRARCLAPPSPFPPSLGTMGVRRRTTTAARAAVAAVLTATIAASVASVHAALDLTVIVSDLVLSTLDLSSGSNAVYAAALMEENCLRRDSRAAAHEVLRFTTTIRNVGDSDLVIGLPPHDHSFSDANWEVWSWRGGAGGRQRGFAGRKPPCWCPAVPPNESGQWQGF